VENTFDSVHRLLYLRELADHLSYGGVSMLMQGDE
jgi:hypothetical protein